MNPCVELAQKTIEKYLTSGEMVDADKTVKDLQEKKAGCFVSIHTKNNNELRGCIGTILPSYKNLAAEIIGNAISACRDPRFEPITKEEIKDLDISVDILSEPEPIASPSSLNPKKYGVIVKAKDGRTGLLLPDLEGVDDAMYQVSIARQKAGIAPEESIFLYRFTVERYKEH